MNAKEKLEAAITKLEDLKAASTPGPWDVAQHYSFDSDAISYGGDAPGVFATFSEAIEEDAELIVTLHRTIDAQLAILLSCTHLRGFPATPTERDVLALADAILGGD